MRLNESGLMICAVPNETLVLVHGSRPSSEFAEGGGLMTGPEHDGDITEQATSFQTKAHCPDCHGLV